MSGQPGTAADPAPVTEPVALVLSRQVRAGHERAFEEVFHRLAAAVRSQPGHLGVMVLRPASGGPLIYTIVSHFRTGADAEVWQASPQRARLIAEADLHAVGELQTRYVSGLEGWLAAPGAPVLVPPARWKTCLLYTSPSPRDRQHRDIQMTGLATDRGGEAVEYLFEGLLMPGSYLAGQHQCHRAGDRRRVRCGPGLAAHPNQ